MSAFERRSALKDQAGRRSVNQQATLSTGHAYVYFFYGFWNCVNVVPRDEGVPQAVLLRALKPVEGIAEDMGPGLFCRAMHIDRALNAVDLQGQRL